MNKRFILSSFVVFGIAIFALLFFFNTYADPDSIDGPVLTKADAVAQVMSAFDQDNKPEVLDARLVKYEDAYAAMGGSVNYELDGYPYKPSTPVWIITVAGNVSHLPMFAKQHEGAIFVVTATDGNVVSMESISDSKGQGGTSFQRIKALADLSGEIEIPKVAPTSEEIVPKSTWTPIK